MRLFALLVLSSTVFAQTSLDRPYGILNQALQDASPLKQISALQAMGVIRPEPKPVAMIEALLSDKDSGVRQNACAVLGEMKSRTSIPKLHDALDDKAPEVVFAAARSLYTMGDAGGRAVLVAILTGDRPDASGLISSSLRDAKLKLHDPKALLMIGINQSAGLLGPFGMGVPIAEMLMKDKEASGKTAVALLFATDTTEQSKAAIRTALSDKNWTVRVAAVRAVAIRGIGAFRPEVVAMLDDKREEVRDSASAALIRLASAPHPPQSRKSGPPAQE
jgi:HEAT repeat protein